jgi:hypothetical protein
MDSDFWPMADHVQVCPDLWINRILVASSFNPQKAWNSSTTPMAAAPSRVLRAETVSNQFQPTLSPVRVASPHLTANALVGFQSVSCLNVHQVSSQTLMNA